jgi:predicted phage terminase large subunit-like protein
MSLSTNLNDWTQSWADLGKLSDLLSSARDKIPSQHATIAERLPLSEFLRGAWQVVEPGKEYVHGWHIDAICEHLEAVTRGEIRNLIINIPPRHMKSLAVSVFWPTWVWTWWPESRWLFSSYADTLATRDSLKCRRIIQSQWYQSQWGDVFSFTSDQNQKTRFENSKMGYRVASGVGGMSTGEGGDFIVVDDPLKAIDASSAAMRESVIEWWDQSMSTRLNNPQRSGKVIVMQRLHENDLTGYLLEKMQADGEHYEHLSLPAEYEPTQHVTSIGWTDPRTQTNELLWPDRFSTESIGNLKRALGSYGSAGQLQQRPSPAEGGLLKRTWWRFWIPKGANVTPVTTRQADGTLFEHPQMELPESFDEVAQSWDMTFKDTKGSDFVAGGVWGKKDADKFMLDLSHGRMDITATIAAVQKLTHKWPDAHLKIIEDKANGPAVISMLRSKVPGLVAYDPKSNKEGRVNAVAPQIESGNVYLPHPALVGWVDAMIDECAAFPNGANDDRVDQMTQILIRWQVKMRKEPRSYQG